MLSGISRVEEYFVSYRGVFCFVIFINTNFAKRAILYEVVFFCKRINQCTKNVANDFV